MTEWTREKTVQLIAEYRKNRGLWDMTHEDYRKKDVKRELLNKVAQDIDGGRIPAMEIEKKFHTLRTQYHREIHRMKRSEPYNSKWFGFKHLEFLSSPKACRQSKGSLSEYIVKREDTGKSHEKQPQIYITPKYGDGSGNNATEYYIERKSEEADNREERSARALEKLIAETTKDVEDEQLLEEELEDDDVNGAEEILDSKSNVIIKHVTAADIYDAQQDHHLHNANAQVHALDEENLQFTGTRILKIQSRRPATNMDYETHYAAEDPLQGATPNQDQNKKYTTYAETPTTYTLSKPSAGSDGGTPNSRAIQLDEFATYGEYIGNELRQIQNRTNLIQVKHKINTAIYEALLDDMHHK